MFCMYDMFEGESYILICFVLCKVFCQNEQIFFISLLFFFCQQFFLFGKFLFSITQYLESKFLNFDITVNFCVNCVHFLPI